MDRRHCWDQGYQRGDGICRVEKAPRRSQRFEQSNRGRVIPPSVVIPDRGAKVQRCSCLHHGNLRRHTGRVLYTDGKRDTVIR